MKKTNTVKKSPVKRTVAKKIKKAPVITQPVKKVNFIPFLVVLALAVLAFLYYRFCIVATVNGKPITRFAYLQNLVKFDQKQILKQMANEALIYQEAKKQGVEIEKSLIDTEIASIEAKIVEQGQTLEAALTAEGMSRTDLESQIRIQKIAEILAKANTEITQAQIDDYLSKNKEYLPTSYTKEQLQELAKTQLTTEIKNEAVNTWFTQIQKDAKIIFR
jgi:hypothetical protein